MSRKYIAIIFIALLVVAAGILLLKKHQTPKTLPDKQVNLSPQLQQQYNDQIQSGQNQLKSLNLSNPGDRTKAINADVLLAYQYFALGKLEQSKQMYLAALKLEPKNESALVGLSVTLLAGGDKTGARQQLETALASNPSNYDTWSRYIDLRKTLGASNAELDQIYQDALKGTSRYIDIVTKYAEFEESTGYINQAISLWQEAAKDYPQNAAAYNAEAARLQKQTK